MKTETGNQIGKEGCNTHSSQCKRKVNCSENVRTYYKATVRANHVPCSVVLHQDGFRVIGALNSWKAQSISTTEAKQQLNDHNSSKNRKNKNSNRQLNPTEQYQHGVKFFVCVFNSTYCQQHKDNSRLPKSIHSWDEPPLVITDSDVGFGLFVLQCKHIKSPHQNFWFSLYVSTCVNSSIQ